MKRLAKIQLNRITLVIILSAVVATASLITYYYATRSTSAGPTHIFTLIVDQRGYNDSRYHQLPYPLMGVMINDNVVIRLVNNDTAEAHGLSVASYVVSGPVTQPGETKSISFQATKAGEFRVYESLLTSTYVFAKAELLVAQP